MTEDGDRILEEIRTNLARVREGIGAAARRAGKDAKDISLVAITKNMPVELVVRAVELGQRVFGENRVQEARGKISSLPGDLEWHMVGRLQSNKARAAAEMFRLVQSVDRESLAGALDRIGKEGGAPVRCLIQVNITGSGAQGGVPFPQAAEFIEKMSALPYLRICGLMAIGPYPAEESEMRKAYRDMKGLFDRMSSFFAERPGILSMGMSGDYAVAIEEGSTMVRVGTAIFGDRR